jgi:copper chaperone CopZ
MTTATFNIGGMHCPTCAVRNERTLKKFKGVLDATVNFATRSARVEFDDAVVSIDALLMLSWKTAIRCSSPNSREIIRSKRGESFNSPSSERSSPYYLRLLPPSWGCSISICRGRSLSGMSASGFKQS